MLNKILAASALLFAACIDQPAQKPESIVEVHPAPSPEQPVDHRPGTVDGTARDQGATEQRVDHTSGVVTVVAREPGRNICDLLPSDGPCSLACDPTALQEKYIPLNACVMYACELTDGSVIKIGGCR